ncbi:MAG: cation:proton antiporter [Pseudomonadota bacterium]
MADFLLLSFVFLLAGIVAVPIASRLGLGSVLGYLLAGMAISPLLAALNVDVVSIQHFAEFGVVMMLFLVGLELEPRALWDMRARLLGLGGLQVAGSAAVIAAAAMILGQPPTFAIAIGLIFALSSTAIVLQTLNEKGLMRSDGGQASFSVLLAQDIAVIPMLALFPLLAMPELMDVVAPAADAAHGAGAAHGDGHSDEHAGDHGGGMSLVDGLSPLPRVLITLGAIALVIVGGSLLTRPIFRFVAMANLRELFVATALCMVVGIALLMTVVGLSPALGTFLAGVVLANSEYRHELESDIDPFRGLLLGLFFITVGAALNFSLLAENLLVVIGLTIGLLALKGGVLYVLGILFKVEGSSRWLFALGLAQAGEFAFVLLAMATANSVLPASLAGLLVIVVTLSMLATPGLFILYDRVIAPRFADAQTQEADEIDEQGTVIIAGHGRWGGIVNRILRTAGYETVVLDHDSRQLEMLRAFNIRVFFGDATRPDLLHAAGIEQAKMLVVAIDDRNQATELVQYVTKAHPHVYIIARARDRNHVYELYGAGCRDIIRETFDSGVRAGRSALVALGMHPYTAQRRAHDFERRDRYALAQLASVYDPSIPIHENKPYVDLAIKIREEQEAEMRSAPGGFGKGEDRSWSPPTTADVRAAEEGRARASGE